MDGAPARVRVSIETEGGRNCVVIDDTGVGMTREELSTQLLAVGESSKSTWESAPDDLASLKRIVSQHANVIGKYGIGFLAAFILADKVVVTTRKENSPPEEAWRLEVRLDEGQPPVKVTRDEPGTEVRLYVRPAQSGNREFNRRLKEIVSRRFVEGYITRLLHFSTVPIVLDTPRGDKTLSMLQPDLARIDPEELLRVLAGAYAEGRGDRSSDDGRCHIHIEHLPTPATGPILADGKTADSALRHGLAERVFSSLKALSLIDQENPFDALLTALLAFSVVGEGLRGETARGEHRAFWKRLECSVCEGVLPA